MRYGHPEPILSASAVYRWCPGLAWPGAAGFVLVMAGGLACAAETALPYLGVLVEADGARETWAYCTACHSERLVAQQGLTREGWEEVLEFMVEEQGMLPIEGADRERVLVYLSTHYGTDRPNFPKQ